MRSPSRGYCAPSVESQEGLSVCKAAHEEDGNVPNIIISLEDNSAYAFGYMIYFFFKACGMSCYLLDINPFNQPGVEVYKKKMFKLLGKE